MFVSGQDAAENYILVIKRRYTAGIPPFFRLKRLMVQGKTKIGRITVYGILAPLTGTRCCGIKGLVDFKSPRYGVYYTELDANTQYLGRNRYSQ
jgi:hypothetical protein